MHRICTISQSQEKQAPFHWQVKLNDQSNIHECTSAKRLGRILRQTIDFANRQTELNGNWRLVINVGENAEQTMPHTGIDIVGGALTSYVHSTKRKIARKAACAKAEPATNAISPTRPAEHHTCAEPDAFCMMLEGKLTPEYVLENDDHFVIVNSNPRAEVHLLAIPIKHTRDVRQMSNLEAGKLLKEIFDLAKNEVYAKQLKHGYRVVINMGENLTQFHTHFQLVAGEALGGMC